MSEDQIALYILMATIVGWYIWSKIRPPSKDKNLHHISDEAKISAHEHFEKVLIANKDFENQKLLEEYAALVKEEVQSILMYFESTKFEDVQEVERRAIYWMNWSKYYMGKTKRMVNKHGFKVVKFEAK